MRVAVLIGVWGLGGPEDYSSGIDVLKLPAFAAPRVTVVLPQCAYPPRRCLLAGAAGECVHIVTGK